MPSHRPRRTGLFALATLPLAACSTSQPAAVIPLLAAPVHVTIADPDFPAAASILDGYDLGASPDEWQVGDRVLIGIRLDKNGTPTTRMLRVELLDTRNAAPVIAFRATPAGRRPYRLESGVYYTRLTLYDADAVVLKECVGEFPERIMGHGLFDGAEPSIGRQRIGDGAIDLSGVSDEQYEHELLGWLSLFSFSTSLGKEGMFNGMVRQVLARPSLLAMLFNPDVSLGMGEKFDIQRRRWAPAPGVSVDGVSMPLTCTISDKLAAVARVHAVRPVAPLGLTGGIVSIDGRNADKPGVRFEVRLLGARRGDRGRAFTTTTQPPAP